MRGNDQKGPLGIVIFKLFVIEGDVGKLLAPCPVDGIGEARVIGIEFGAVGQDLIGEAIQIGNPPGKPGNRIS